jgi:hypothetical protein
MALMLPEGLAVFRSAAKLLHWKNFYNLDFFKRNILYFPDDPLQKIQDIGIAAYASQYIHIVRRTAWPIF